jgi:hypothetical protein
MKDDHLCQSLSIVQSHKKIESISFLESYVVVVLERCRVNFILEEMCNCIKMTISILSKVNYAIALGRL